MIRNFLTQINAIHVNQQTRLFNHVKWRNRFPNEKAVAAFEPLNGRPITKQVVIDEFEKYFKNPDKTPAFQAFLLCMIWGHENTNLGPFRTHRIVTENAASIKDDLQRAMTEINNNVENAFNILSTFNYLGISFVSKILYFAGKAKGLSNYPLIFDSKVARTLVELSCPPEINDMVSIVPRQDWNAYHNYNLLLHRLAAKYDVEAEKVEIFLFNYTEGSN